MEVLQSGRFPHAHVSSAPVSGVRNWHRYRAQSGDRAGPSLRHSDACLRVVRSRVADRVRISAAQANHQAPSYKALGVIERFSVADHPRLLLPPECLLPKQPDVVLSRPSCAACAQGHGDARVVTIKGRDRTVTYVCDGCLHQWDVIDAPKSHRP